MNQVPSYRRHSSGQAFAEIAGHRHYLGAFGSTQSREAYAELVAGHL